MTFARTKIRHPRRRPSAQQIDRPALERRLGAAILQHRLVLLCAAAGFGKTSALARQCELLPPGTAVAWISCDEGDSPMQLFECLVAALEPFDLPWRTEPEALMQVAVDAATHEQRRAVATEVINALDACDMPRGVIIVDDLHRIEHPAVFRFLDDLLERFASHWTLVIASRREPPLSLARLRAQGEVAEFHLEDLRFERDEVRQLSGGAGLGEAEADRLFERTQGWPVGLRLVLNSGPDPKAAAALANPSGRINRHVFDFLADEVIDRLSPALRDFLLATSVLPVLSAARCAALSGDALSATRLEEIEREGLFASVLDTEERTLQLHDLFREALEARFERERPQQFVAALLRAAATEGDLARRVAWLQRAGAWDEAEATLAGAAQELIASGRASQVRSMFERFPAQRRESSAHLQMLIAQSRWDWDKALEAAGRAARGFAEQGADLDRLRALSYRCLALAGANHAQAREAAAELLAEPGLAGDALCRALVSSSWVELPRGDQRELAALWRRLNDTLQRSDELAIWMECAPLGPLVGLPGMRAELLRYLDGARARLPDRPSPLRSKCSVMQGWLDLFAGRVADAEGHAAAAADDARWLASPADLDAPCASLQAVLHALRGRRDLALGMLGSIIGKIEASGVRLRIDVYLSLYLFLAVRCAALLDDADTVRAFAPRLLTPEGGLRSWLSPHQASGAAAHLAAARGDLAAACTIWQRIVDDEFHGDLYGQVIESRLRLADALLRSGVAPGRAAEELLPLFERVQQGGEWGAVLFAGPSLLRRLSLVAWGDGLSADQCDLLGQWARASATLLALDRGPSDQASAQGDGLAAGRGGGTLAGLADRGASHGLAAGPRGTTLTSRELDVLSRIAAGDSNKVIARALELSPHTVKRHVANILDKLDLQSRGQAAAWHRKHG